jgi:FixJ family two-component response regulator
MRRFHIVKQARSKTWLSAEGKNMDKYPTCACDDQSSDPPKSITGVVFIVDGDSSVREALEQLISRAGLRAKTFASAEAFLASPRALVPSCLVLDLMPPDLSGLDVQRRIAEQPELPIIFIAALADIATTVRAMKAGAIEFLTKPLVDEVVLSAVRHALDASRTLLIRKAAGLALRGRYESLSRREKQVMALVVAGCLNKEVGGQLGISEITVKAHRGNVMRKMEARSLPALVYMATTLGVAQRALRISASESNRRWRSTLPGTSELRPAY